MRNHIFVVGAVTIGLLGLPQPGQGQNSPGKESGYQFVERLLTHGDHVNLTADQVAQLDKLAAQLRTERGRPTVSGFDRVPGKSVPRVVYVRTNSKQAQRLAFKILNQQQRAEVAPMLAIGGGKSTQQ